MRRLKCLEISHGEKNISFTVLSEGAEYLVMGNLMRRNILTYKAPPLNEGCDLICIHPDPRHKLPGLAISQVRIQVKSRYATDCDRGFPLNEKSKDAFDFLVVAFLNIGKFFNGRDGSEGMREPEFTTLPRAFIAEHHHVGSVWQRVRLRGLDDEILKYKNERGFELIAKALGVKKPRKP